MECMVYDRGRAYHRIVVQSKSEPKGSYLTSVIKKAWFEADIWPFDKLPRAAVLEPNSTGTDKLRGWKQVGRAKSLPTEVKTVRYRL